MNRERLLEVADAIEANPANFEMGLIIKGDGTAGDLLSPSCGTVGCIAGYACALYSPRVRPAEIEEFAALILRLDSHESLGLFYINLNQSIWRKYAGQYGIPLYPTYSDITAEVAVNVLRALAKGEISF